MEWKKAQVKDNNLVEIPERWLHLYYYEALNVLFRFENSLRVFVYTVLKEELKEKWQETAVSGGCIKSETKKRMRQSDDYGYLGHEITSPMLFLNSGELIDIIVSDAYWKYFAKYFKASKSIVITKLQEIGTVRNSLAHFRPIKEDDIDLIKQNTKHVLLEVEKALVKITSISALVPTNSDEPWYLKLKALGSENINLSLFYCEDENWVRLSFLYKIPTLLKSKITEEFYTYKVGDLRTVEVLRNFQVIKDNCIYVADSYVLGRLNADFDVVSNKEFSVVLSKRTLTDNIDSLESAIRDIITKVDEETELLKSDDLARGVLVEPKHANASVKTGHNNNRYWQVALDALKPDSSKASEVEYWGTRGHYVTDFVSATQQYPWMPSSISDLELPF
ncbi:Swt1 family HEPN domain-containing protein [Thalassolituus sp. C2-1]|uniref:Swt1 family HEPN domain-containing protein n=1 Tax=Venatorbacter sp. C2-1 TaxID=2597518 RepID=UPI001192F99C|nr:Swt1 family HEPN domain-containing protein [Thalassolituus sp. C2-1]TVV44144.1 hypothetical protein FOT50_10990 [Thalassolituus sp. C2-1]